MGHVKESTKPTAVPDALFAPFGNELTWHDKHAATETILRRPAYGHRMWIGAVDFAANTDGYLV